jgi:hypothetical protein
MPPQPPNEWQRVDCFGRLVPLPPSGLRSTPLRTRYWLHFALIALLVLLAYALGAAAGGGNGNMSTLFVERLTDVSLGAILALIGTAVAFPHRVDGDADGDDKGPPR